jgi:hypothetical protein
MLSFSGRLAIRGFSLSTVQFMWHEVVLKMPLAPGQPALKQVRATTAKESDFHFCRPSPSRRFIPTT